MAQGSDDAAVTLFDVRLKVGRVLSGKWLTAVVLVRNLSLALVTATLLDAADWYAPTWVIVTRRRDGKVVGRLAGGRFGEGPALLQSVRSSLNELSEREFVERWHLRG
jgi:hypothetical protein